MTLQQLRYLTAVADAYSFSEAAARCGVTQPTLSAMLSKLEAELGVTFFDRKRKPVRVTPIGEVVISRARRVLAEAEAIPAAIAETREDLTGTVRLGILPTIAPYLVPLFLGEFATAYPQLRLAVQELKTADIAYRLHDGRLDLGIASTPHDKLDGIAEHFLFRERFYTYAHTPPPTPTVLAKDLDPDELWVLEEGHCFGDQVLELCNLSRSSHTLQYVSGSIDTLRRIVEAQGGVTVLPELAMRTLSPIEQERVRPFASPSPERTISLLTRPDFVRQRLVAVLAKAVQEVV